MSARRILTAATLTGLVIAAAVVSAATASSSGTAFLIHQETSLVSSAEGDGFAEAGEAFTFNVQIRNIGDTAATGVSASLSSPNFTVQQGTSAYPDIAPGASATNTTPFSGTLPSNASCGEGYWGILSISSQQGGRNVPAVIPVSSTRQTQRFTSTTPVPINDFTGVESPLSLGTPGPIATILDLNVRIDNLQHTNVEDLTILLRPAGWTGYIGLVINRGPGANFVNTVLDDEASTTLDHGVAPFTGSFIPDSGLMLAGVDAADATGTWHLRVDDDYAGDTGQLNSWGLDAVTAKCNNAPTPSFQSNPLDPVAGRPAALTATSTDADGLVVEHTWDLDNDGQFDDGTGFQVSRTFTTPGSATVRIRAVDSGGNAAIGSQQLSVVRARATTRATCRVPRVVGKRLALARRLITRGGCRVGRIRRARSRRVGRVLRQSPRGGVRRARGTRVNLVVGRR